jgi:hypothetical protein
MSTTQQLATEKPRRARKRTLGLPTYTERAIDLAIADAVAAGTTMAALKALRPLHRNHLLDAQLKLRGFSAAQLPSERSYRRYFKAI